MRDNLTSHREDQGQSSESAITNVYSCNSDPPPEDEGSITSLKLGATDGLNGAHKEPQALPSDNLKTSRMSHKALKPLEQITTKSNDQFTENYMITTKAS
ncbi:hypothetical protein L1987_52166 [Smallanthus sonchifolius]|uniref:Uncharacterized protein n=1 Tax=Smallanthus sonchifolius TaxID=185202 RepID=A0ACB9ES25_9ASTR|nr:hypothetical protein L1987_52166 [Smallanthus sonchifolius]